MDLTQVVSLLALCVCHISAQEDTSSQINQEIYEESPPNTYIVEIPVAAGFSSNYSQEQLASMRFNILSSSEHPDFFSLDEVSGTLRTAQVIDREEVCPAQVSCVIQLDIGIQVDGDFIFYKVFVNILDNNDNAPVFIQSTFTRSIAENTAPGASFSIPNAEDMDSPRYGVKDYSLIQGSPQFSLKKVNNTDGSMDIYLVLQEELDRENQDRYQAMVAAYDGDVTPNVGTLPIEIVIEDVNDNHPYFETEIYQVVIREDMAVGSLVTQVSASDDDAGINGQIVYGFSTKTERSYGDTFAINNITGSITVKNALSYADNHEYILGVTARDMNPDSLAAAAQVIIQVEDVNDHAPEITVSALTDSGNVQITEDEPIGTFVAFVAVSDPDSGDNGEFSCQLGGTAFDLQRLDVSQFKIVTAHEFDRETLSQYNLQFVCTDNGSPSLTSSAVITVSVLDVNDHTPQFSKQIYSVQMAENNTPGTFIIKVEASDLDAGSNGQIEYRVVGAGGTYININPTTGDVTARMVFDYEQSPLLELELQAFDSGNPRRNSTALLRITLTDEDDNLPQFMSLYYAFDVYENQPPGALVDQVVAHDADSEDYSQLVYVLVSGQGDAEYFQVDQTDGQIFTTQRLDRETQSTFEFMIRAMSTHDTAKSSLTTVRVDVNDQNDNAPYMIFPRENNNSLSVPSQVEIGTEVVRVLAGDRDIGINAKLNYVLTDGTENDYFDLDYDTGVISIKSSIKDLEDMVIQLHILVRDGGQPYYDVSEWLNISINRTSAARSNNNLTIVISVVTISGLLTVVLVVAIVITKRMDQKKNIRYVPKLSSAGLMFTNIKNASSGSSNDNSLQDDDMKMSKTDISFSNDVTLEEEVNPKVIYPAPKVEKSHSFTGKTQYDAAGLAVHGGNPYGRRHSGSVQPSASYNQQIPLASGKYAPPKASTSYNDYAIQVTIIPADAPAPSSPGHQQLSSKPSKDKDSDSTNSASISNTDSGRGSNEDTTDSRRSPVDRDFPPMPRDGIVLRPPQSSVHRPRTPPRDYHKAPHLAQTTNAHKSAMAGKPARRPPPPVGSKPGTRPSAASTPQKPQRQINNNVIPVGYHSQKPNAHRPHHSQPNYPQRDLSRHGTNLHGIADTSDSDGDFSDEDQEYVYYVNASHV